MSRRQSIDELKRKLEKSERDLAILKPGYREHLIERQRLGNLRTQLRKRQEGK